MLQPLGMNRRHFLKHVAGYSMMAVPGLEFLRVIQGNAEQMRRNNKSLIIMWMGGGPATIDIWDGGELPATVGAWSVHQVDIGPGFVAALATPGDCSWVPHAPRVVPSPRTPPAKLCAPKSNSLTNTSITRTGFSSAM